MPVNFNVIPFNDDFSETKHFYRVLFRPSVAVQARELTQSQSILQQQITYFGDSIYKHGSMVIPGGLATDPNTAYVRLNPTFGFIGSTPIPINLPLFTGQVIQGDITGIQAQVVYSTPAVGIDPPTLFVKYMTTGLDGQATFVPGENLFIAGTVQNLAQVQTTAPTGLCISAQIDEGVYYVYGIFVRVEKQYILLNKYDQIVSCRVGLQINESIVTFQDDPSLTDNAQGSNNYAAPGADRYKIDLVLTSKLITDISPDATFIELLRLADSVTQISVKTDTYSVIEKELASRMYDTNGDFTVRNFQIDVREHLDTSFVTTGTVVSAAAGTPTYITLAASASPVDGTYVGNTLYISNGTGAGQTFTITAYTGSTKTATLNTNYLANETADSSSTYVISDPTKINRGIYRPPPFGPGDSSQLAIGLEAGRAYVDGYLVNTLVTDYVAIPKARDTSLTQNAVIPANVGSYVLVKNLYNIPIPSSVAPNDFLQISLSNKKANGSFTPSTDQVGTARVHAIEFFQGVNQSDSTAVFKMYLFNIQMNSGQTIDTARSFYLTNNLGNNNNGDSLGSYGDICAQFSLSNVNGTGLVAGNSFVGPNNVGSELIVSFDPINNILVTEPPVGNGNQVLTLGLATVSGGTSATINLRAQLIDAGNSILIYPLPQRVVKTVTGGDNAPHTNFTTRRMFEATRNGSGLFIFNSSSDQPFDIFNTTDYLACIVASSNSPDIGKFVNLAAYINSGSFSGSPANTTLTIHITSGLGSVAGCTMKLMATVIKSAQNPKLKTMTNASLAIATPTGTMSLQKADVYQVTHIWDSMNPSVAANPANTSNVDILAQYRFDTGQRDYFYDDGAVQLLTGAPGPVGQILIQFQYFAHSGSSDFFTVDSYTNQIDYTLIPTYTTSNTTYALRDCLDFRPRKGDTVGNFSATGSSYSYALKPNSIVQADFQYYLPRIDKIYADQYGNFNDIQGTSALIPQPPPDPVDGMMLYTIALNAYTVSTTDLNVTPTNNRRYTMSDIAKLDSRITNLEYYTSLNLLEQQTKTTQVVSATTGLDAFQNGFVVDTFIGHNVGDIYDGDYKCSVDPTEGSLRPEFIESNNTLSFYPNISTGYVQLSKKIMLPYQNILMVAQTYATGTCNVNPFAVFTFNGSILLDPDTDTWIDTIQLPIINATNNTALAGYTLNQWSGVTWGSWQTQWVGTPQSTTTGSTLSFNALSGLTATVISGPTFQTTGYTTYNSQTNTFTANSLANPNVFTLNARNNYSTNSFYTDSNGNVWNTSPEYTGQEGTVVSLSGSTATTTTQQVGQVRLGTQSETVAQTTSQTINNSLVDVSLSPYIRPRRIKITGTHLKPNTRMYPFFDGTDVSAYCRPFSDSTLTPSLAQSSWTTESILWGGDYSPQDNANVGVSESGDQGSTATYTIGALNNPIYTDASGTTTLFFEIPCTNAAEFKVGARVFRLTDSSTNDNLADAWGDGTYNASGIIDQNQETITSIVTPQVVTKTVSQTQTVTNSQSTSGQQTFTIYADPLAESFLISQPGGVFITKVDIFFASTDSSVPITLSIRAMQNGYPSQTVVPFSTKTLYPNNPILSALDANGNKITGNNPYSSAVINISNDASIATSFIFDCPVYLNDGTEYAIVLIANSTNYNVYTATLGGTVLGSTSVVSKTPYLGSFFKSQNASTWIADPTTNLKFNIWRATFDTTQTGQIYFTNSTLIPDTLGSLPFQTESGSNIVRILHPNHGMPKGQFSNSVVTLANIPAGTYNGLTNLQLTGNFNIDHVDLDSYTITVGGSSATGTGLVGPDGVTATKNSQYDSLCLLINEFEPTGTDITWGAQGTTGKSPNNNSYAQQEPYIKDAAFSTIQENLTVNLSAPRMFCSDINESTNIAGITAFDKKSFVLNGTLSTTLENLSPIIDNSRVSTILVNTRLDDPTFSSYTIQSMDVNAVVTSNSSDPLTFASSTILTVVGVTGGIFASGDTVTGAVSGATGTFVSYDSVNLTLSGVVGAFLNTETVTGSISNAIGTVLSQTVVNTIKDTNSGLDFSVFRQGYVMTITGTTSANHYLYANPVVILSVIGNTITVDTTEYANGVPFVAASGETATTLTQYNRFVAETGPDGCTAAARYITRQLPLAGQANSLHIYFDINLPPGSFVDVYYRVQKANISGNFNDLVWTLVPVDGTVNTNNATNSLQFNEYTYSADQIGTFTAFAVKIVMRGGNSSLPPRIQNFRAIALTM